MPPSLLENSNCLKKGVKSDWSMSEHSVEGGESEAWGVLTGSIPGMRLTATFVLLPAGGGCEVEGKRLSWSPREMWQGEFIFWEKEGTSSDSSFLHRGIGKTLGALQSCPSWARFTNVWGVIVILGLRKMRALSLQPDTVLPNTNTAVWFDVTHYGFRKKYQRKDNRGHGQVIWTSGAE